MKRALAVLCLLAAAACSNEAKTGQPEATVTALYQPLVISKGQDSTPLTSIPMTPEFDALTKQALKANDDFPVFDFDPAGLCQDCTDFSDLKVIPAPANAIATPAAGHKLVEASFKIQPGDTRTVYWDMVETPNGWVVDNILAKDFSFRRVAEEAIAAVDTEGDKAVECMAYLRLHGEALKAATPAGDTAPLEAAEAAWSKKAEAFYKADELAQYFASSIAVLDDLPPEELKIKAQACLAPPQN